MVLLVDDGESGRHDPDGGGDDGEQGARPRVATATPQGNSQPRASRCAEGSPEHSTPASAPAASPTACLSTQIAKASWTAVAATEAASITTRAGQSESR